ncbi:MAG TPA: hypothetical protein VJ888_02065 [Mobilitalea sp.]|nr:hypothetical protein [Mobilitalea sp.]
MGRKLLINAVLVFCMICLTACAQETGDSNEITSVTDKAQKDEFLVVSDMNSIDEVSGFAIDFEIERWSMDTFKGQVIEVSDIIRKQYENVNPLSSTTPSWWMREFDSIAKIQEYLGCDRLIIPTWDLEETMSTLTVIGDEEGTLEKLCVEIYYVTDNLRMQSFSYIFTEASDENSFLYEIGDTYLQEEGLTSNGFEYDVITSSENEYGYICKDGFMIKNGVLYNFHLAYTAEYEKEAEARLEQWFANY